MKFRLSRRSQTSMEMLSTYGWAVLIVLAAIAAMTYFGVFRFDKLTPETCFIPSTSGLYCEDKVAKDNEITFSIKNVLGETQTISEMTVLGEGVDCHWNGSVTLEANQRNQFVLPCTELRDRVSAELIINHSKSGSDFQKVSRSSLEISKDD